MSNSIGTFKGQPAEPGIPFAPNSVASGDGYHVSFNDRDYDIFGDITTALVIGQGDLFLTLNGDHRAGFAKASESGFEGCLTYFDDHIAQSNYRSEQNYKKYRWQYWTLLTLCCTG